MGKRYENRGATLAAYIMLHKPAGADPHPAYVGRLVGEMQSHARSVKRMSEHACGHFMTEPQQAEAHRRLLKYEDGINRAFRGAGLANMHLRLCGTPGGACGYLEITDANGETVTDCLADGLAIY